MYCIHCGKQNSDNANFCQYCGGAIDLSVPSPTESVLLDGEPIIEDTEPTPQAETKPPVEQEEKDHKKGLAITGLVLSSVGLGVSVICCVYFGSMLLGIPLCVAGIILCAISMKSPSAKTIAITGLIIGIVGAIIGLLMLSFLFTVLSIDTGIVSFFNEILDEMMYY